MFSKTCQYAIRAMIFVAQKSHSKSIVGIKEIVENTSAPKHFIAKILQDLTKKKLLKSIKGPNGGFYIDSKKSIKLSEIVKTIDGDKLFTECILGLKQCNENKPCPVHFNYKEIKCQFIELMETMTVDEFNQKLLTKQYFLKN